MIRCYSYLMLLVALLLTGCDGSGPYKDIREYLAQVKEQQSKAITNAKLDVNLPVAVIYNGNMRRSPFEENAQLAGTVKPVSTNPLQAYSLNMLRLLGTVTEKGETVAYVTTPDNMVYRIKVGDIIGDHHGKVINIQPGNVNVMELDSDNPNEQMQRVVSLKLRNET